MFLYHFVASYTVCHVVGACYNMSENVVAKVFDLLGDIFYSHWQCMLQSSTKAYLTNNSQVCEAVLHHKP